MRLPVTLILATMMLAGCGGPGEAADTGDNSSNPSTSTATESSSAETPPDNPSVGKFGESLEFQDGLAVVVSEPNQFTPSPEADMDGYPLPTTGTPVRFKITITNNTVAPTAEDFFPLVSVTSQGESLQEVGLSDFSFGMTGLAKTARILPEKKAISEMGYFVVDPADVSVDVAIGGYDTLTFSAAGG